MEQNVFVLGRVQAGGQCSDCYSGNLSVWISLRCQNCTLLCSQCSEKVVLGVCQCGYVEFPEKRACEVLLVLTCC